MAKSRQSGSKRMLTSIRETILKDNSTRLKLSNFFIQEDIFSVRQKIPIPRQEFKFERPTIMAFADDAPLYNWSHPCRYLLYDANNGQLYKEISASFPPYVNEKETPKSFYAFHQPLTFSASKLFSIPVQKQWRWYFQGNRYAILFSGMSNNRHTNDLEFAYRTLIDVYGFSPANIRVLNYNGTLNYNGGPQPATKWPGDNSAYRMPVHASGTKANLLAAIDALKPKLKSQDMLFIHTNNHGGHNGIESDLCCYPNYNSLGVKEFTDKLAELPAYRCLMVMMEQCHSGGFNNAIISKSTSQNTSIASACTELKNSIGGENFDPFARDWIAAMMGADPYGHALAFNPDASGGGRVSAKEAFSYANAVHDPYDTPVFNFSGSGNNCWLGASHFIFPPIKLITIEALIRKHWPDPDPIILQKLITELNEKSQTSFQKAQSSIDQNIKALEKEVTLALNKILR